jgi:hypothetical protein
VAECDLPKVETRVRFPLLAHLFCGYVFKQRVLELDGEVLARCKFLALIRRRNLIFGEKFKAELRLTTKMY